MKKTQDTLPSFELPKAKTGIQGLDEITGGGLPRGRPTLVCGSAGCGKTMLAAEFIVRGATAMGEPGVFMTFEESAAELSANVRSLGFDLDRLVRQKKVALDFVHIERSEIEETGEYDLEGLFIRLGHAIDTIGAKRVVLDTVEALFAGLPNHAILRAELRRLFRWLVILLDHRIVDQVSTRRLRVVKYRGTAHGTNEYPFLIGAAGLSVLPITSMRLEHKALSERVPTGIAGLDAMLGGKGVYRGSSVLVSGSPGTGKSTVAASFLDATCRRRKRALLFCYEESASQVIRNMRSVGVDLAPWVESGRLLLHATRPTLQGLEQHLVEMYSLVQAFRPALVVVDPISNLTISNTDSALKATLMRLIDFLKEEGITGVFTSLTGDGTIAVADSELGVSSLMDTWLMLANIEANGERTRTIQVLKSRGMPHSNQVREFVVSRRGIELVDVYMPEDRVLTGSERVAHASRAEAASARSSPAKRKEGR